MRLGVAYASLPGYTVDPYNRVCTPVFFGQTVATVSSDVETYLVSNFVLDTYKIFAIGGSYQIGKLTLIAQLHQYRTGSQEYDIVRACL
ncbi:hypothetical protein B0G57_1393 [Trinickia symbiotica]|nr:hypothetical protein B0G57_1393 [Trinickia symbiotica]